MVRILDVVIPKQPELLVRAKSRGEEENQLLDLIVLDAQALKLIHDIPTPAIVAGLHVITSAGFEFIARVVALTDQEIERAVASGYSFEDIQVWLLRGPPRSWEIKQPEVLGLIAKMKEQLR